MGALLAVLAILLESIVSSVAHDTPVQYEIEYRVQCLPLATPDGVADGGHDDCVTELINRYYDQF